MGLKVKNSWDVIGPKTDIETSSRLIDGEQQIKEELRAVMTCSSSLLHKHSENLFPEDDVLTGTLKLPLFGRI